MTRCAECGRLSSALVCGPCARYLDGYYTADVPAESQPMTAAGPRATGSDPDKSQPRGSAGMNLYPHQVDGARFLASRSRACLFDEMGLGKTATALSALPENAAALVVCPAVAKLVWRDEAAKWRPDLEVSVLSGRGSFRWPIRGELVVINYDLLDRVTEAPRGIAIIADEAHYLKSWTSKRSRAFRTLTAACFRASGTAWLLTGTPLLRDPYDLWCVLGSIGLAEATFGDFGGFRILCGAKDKRIVVGNGTRRRTITKIEWGRPNPMVRQMLRAVALRRTREEVALDIPPKTLSTITVDCLSPEALRDMDALASRLTAAGVDLEDAVAQALDERGTAFEEIAKTRRALATLKVKALGELLDSYAEAGRPVVLFSAHRAPVVAAGSRAFWATITGDTSQAERRRATESFQAGRLAGIALTIQAGGTAITLTAASDVVFVDQTWTPAENLQAEDRICRIGQKRPVQIVILQADHEVERAVARVLRRKTEMFEATI